MREQMEANAEIKYIRNVVVGVDGESRTYYVPKQVVRSEEFDIPILNPTGLDYFKALFLPDFVEILLIGVAFFLNLAFIRPQTSEPLLSSGMIVFWGILVLILTTARHAYWGPGHYSARLSMIHKKHMEGKFVADFNLFGVLISLYMIFYSTAVAEFFFFMFHPF